MYIYGDKFYDFMIYDLWFVWKLVRISWFSGLSYDCEIDNIAQVNKTDL